METLPSENIVAAVREVAIEYADKIGYSLSQPHALCRVMMVVLLEPDLKKEAYARAYPQKVLENQ